MMRGIVALTVLSGLSLSLAAPPAIANVLTFDDLAGYAVAVPSSYQGFNFSGWYIDSTCSGAGFTGTTCNVYPYTPESYPTTIYTFGSDSISNSTPFVFSGAYFTGNTSASYQFLLYSGGNLVWKSSVLTASATPTFLASGYSQPIDTVVVTGNSLSNGVMDNFTYTLAPPAASSDGPIPLWALGALSAGLLGIASRRLKKAV